MSFGLHASSDTKWELPEKEVEVDGAVPALGIPPKRKQGMSFHLGWRNDTKTLSLRTDVNGEGGYVIPIVPEETEAHAAAMQILGRANLGETLSSVS
jgi:hypothetical protein